MTDTEGVQDRKDTAEPALEEQVQRKYTKEPSLQEHVAGICTTDDMTYTEEIQMSFPLENPDEDSETFTATEDNAIQEKRQLDVENQKLNMFLNSTLENFNLIEEEKKQLNLHLNESLKIITLQGAESKQLHQLLLNEQLNSMQLKAANEHQLSILFSTKMGFIWRFCNRDTLRCSHCPPGWTEHASRCFILSHEPKKWENARIECLDYGGDLAMVWNKEDQALLTNMTFQYVQQNPSEDFHSAWIGLQDMVQEGTFYWVNGDTIKWNVIYWMDQEPNNAMDNWDLKGQDCVAIVPPTRIGAEDWLNSWDDSVCEDRRHYICETTALILG
ncbi:hypothetical protein D5F01_LYC03657 [Larimichthys crocea]|uniref:C-type lectin domain-containing protein n=1 Tax=Larimichthys crocea TaxID=215358 RepID=A0A6G0J0D4_LARCR|nr:hypothetical protein D5F01_LYC03657 [Larimichthys crocea]